MFSGETANTNFIVFGLYDKGSNPWAPWDVHANHYINMAFSWVSLKLKSHDIAEILLKLASPWYSWNITKVGIKHQSINQLKLKMLRDIPLNLIGESKYFQILTK